MRTISYWRVDPTGNITVLAQTDCPRGEYPALAAHLMQYVPDAEQVGFLEHAEAADVRLQMAGGEFCGNATLSAAAWHCQSTGLCSSERKDVFIEVSGAQRPLHVGIEAESSDTFLGVVAMPLPIAITTENLPLGDEFLRLPVVTFPGISHVIVEDHLLKSAQAENAVKQWSRQLRVDALGIMLWDEAQASLRPLVYVAAADTLFWEHSCASGSSAVGAYAALKLRQDVSLNLSQPGGILTVSAAYREGRVIDLTIKGRVHLGKKNVVNMME